jgi:hypothetical protein
VEKNPYLMPGAVVIAGALIGAGLFLGLKSDGRDGSGPLLPAGDRPSRALSTLPDGTPSPAAPRSPSPPSAAPANRDAPSPPAVLPPDAQADVDLQVKGQIDRRKPDLARLCWAPSVAKSPAPASAQIAVRFLFDAAGKPLYTAVADPADARRKDVSECLRAQGLGVTIQPRGVNVASAVMLAFP